MKNILIFLLFSNSLFASTIIQFQPGIERIPERLESRIKGLAYELKPMRSEPRFFIQRMPETKWDIIKKDSNLAILIHDDKDISSLQHDPLIKRVLQNETLDHNSPSKFQLKYPSADFPKFPCENTVYLGDNNVNFTQSIDEAKACDGYWIDSIAGELMNFEISGGKHLEIFEDGILKGETDSSLDFTFSHESTQKIVVVRGGRGEYEVSWHPKDEKKTVKNSTLADFSNAFGFGSLEVSEAFHILTQKKLKKGGTPKHQGAKMMNVGMLWSEGFKGQNVRVAVIDTGVDFDHPFLKDWVEDGFNVIDPSKKPIDDESHGTHVAGVIHQVAPLAKIVPIKVLDKDGSGSIDDVIAGIDWAIKDKVQVINLSLGGDIDQKKLENVFKKANAHGILIAMASGNDSADQPTFPARYVTKIPGLGFAVGAINSSWQLANFSDRSGFHKAMKYVAAHGVNVNSSIPGGSYKKFSGTSMATPQVAGAIALIKSIPDLKPNKAVIDALSQSVYQTSIEYP